MDTNCLKCFLVFQYSPTIILTDKYLKCLNQKHRMNQNQKTARGYTLKGICPLGLISKKQFRFLLTGTRTLRYFDYRQKKRFHYHYSREFHDKALFYFWINRLEVFFVIANALNLLKFFIWP